MKIDSSKISPELLMQLKSYVYDIIGCCQDVHKELGQLFRNNCFHWFFFSKVLIFVRICFGVGKKMGEVHFQPVSLQQQNEARSAKTFKKGFKRFLFY